MERMVRGAMILGMLLVVVLAVASCAPGAAPTPTSTTAPAATPAAAPKIEATKPAATSPTAPPKALAPYKIGVVLSQSGPFSGLGIPGREAAVATVNEINAAGGVNGRKLDLVVEDDGGDETKAILAVKKLIDTDKVLAFVGPTGTGLSMAAIPVIEEAKVAALVYSGSDAPVDPVRKYVFKFVPGDRKIYPEIHAYFKSKGVKKLAVLYPATATGKSALAFIQSNAPKEGFELVAPESYDVNDKDFAAQLTKIKAAGGEALIIPDSSVATALIARQMKTLGLNIPWSGPYGLASPVNVQTAGDAFDGLVLPVPKVYVAKELPDSDPQKKVSLDFQASVQKATGKETDPIAMHGWDGVMIISEALRKNNPDPANLEDARAKVRDGIESLKGFPAVVGVLTLSPQDHEGLPAGWSAMAELRGGKFSLFKK